MKESEIRPEELHEENKKLFREDVNFLLEKKSKFLNVNCPACGEKEFLFKFNKGGFNFLSCKNCLTVYVSPRPSFNLLIEYYNTSKSIQHWNNKLFPLTEEFRRKEIFLPRMKKVLDLCKSYGINHEIIIDVGAGFGTFCEEIKKEGYFRRVIAVEPSRFLAATCMTRGLETINKTIEEVNLKNVDVVTNFELISHVFSPEEFVKKVNSILVHKGILFLTTPNVLGFDVEILGKDSSVFAAPNMINYFNINSIKHLLEKNGFKILEILTPGKLDVNLVRTQLNQLNVSSSLGSFFESLFKSEDEEFFENFQNFISKNRLSSHMWVVAQKIS